MSFGDHDHRDPHERRADRRSRRRAMAGLAAITVGALAAFVYATVWQRDPRLTGLGEPPAPANGSASRRAPHPAVAQSRAPTPEPTTERTPNSVSMAGPIDTPVLDASDEWVRQSLSRLSRDPDFTGWIGSEDLLRRFVAIVDNIAEGLDPRPHLRFVKLTGPFLVEEVDELLLLDPASYARYDRITSLLTGLDPASLARLYTRAFPLMQQAYQELGYPDRSFESVMEGAIAELLAAPILQGNVELEPLNVTYGYVDYELEDLSSAQKQLLRMGPENTRQVQLWLRELADGIGMELEALPSTRVHIPRSARELEEEEPALQLQ